MRRETSRPTDGPCAETSPAYTGVASSAVIDGARKHSPWPLMTTTGMWRHPGVHVRLAAESPMEAQRPHLNLGFKVVFARIVTAEDAFPIPLRRPPASRPTRTRTRCGFCVLATAALVKCVSGEASFRQSSDVAKRGCHQAHLASALLLRASRCVLGGDDAQDLHDPRRPRALARPLRLRPSSGPLRLNPARSHSTPSTPDRLGTARSTLARAAHCRRQAAVEGCDATQSGHARR